MKVKANSGSKGKKRNRDPMRSDVDEALYIWFSVARAQSIPISGEMLKAKAEELSNELSLWYIGLVRMDGYLGGRGASPFGQFAVRMPLLILEFVRSGKKRLSSPFFSVIPPLMCSMRTRRDCTGDYFLINPCSQGKYLENVLTETASKACKQTLITDFL